MSLPPPDPRYGTTGDVAADTATRLAAVETHLAGNIVSADITDGTIVNADVNAAAAIAYSKLALASSITIADLSSLALMTLAAQNPTHNGGFRVWQRGTSFAAVANGSYTADRWFYENGSAAVHTILQSSDVPAVAALVPFTNFSIHLDVTTADAAIAAGDFLLESQRIEGYVWAPFAQKQFTVGFWVKDTITGIHCVSVRNSADRSCVIEYTINVADAWEYKTATFPASPSAGTWNYTTGIGAILGFALACGSTYQTTAGAWQVGNFLGTANQVNSLSSTSNNFKVWGVTLGLGATVAPFWPRQFGQELALCQRYYQKSYPYGAAPGTAGNNRYFQPASTPADLNGRFRWTFQLVPEMRASPTVTFYDGPGTAGKISTMSGDVATDNVAPGVGASFLTSTSSCATMTSVEGPVIFNYTLSADL